MKPLKFSDLTKLFDDVSEFGPLPKVNRKFLIAQTLRNAIHLTRNRPAEDFPITYLVSSHGSIINNPMAMSLLLNPFYGTLPLGEFIAFLKVGCRVHITVYSISNTITFEIYSPNSDEIIESLDYSYGNIIQMHYSYNYFLKAMKPKYKNSKHFTLTYEEL